MNHCRSSDALPPETGRGSKRVTGRQALFFLLGCINLLLAAIGALLPLMPSTIFLIVAAWSFGRSSTRLENWMLNHQRFGPVLRSWRERGAMPRRAKIMAWSGMTFGYVVFMVSTRPDGWIAISVAAALVATAAWIAARPEY